MSAHPFRIYYEDTDFSGFVYHARYLHFFERARTEALRGVGIDQRALFEREGGPFGFVVRRMSIDYRLPARMDDVVEIETRITKLSGASLTMDQVMRRMGEVLCSAEVTIAFLAKGRAARMPEAMRAALAALHNP